MNDKPKFISLTEQRQPPNQIPPENESSGLASEVRQADVLLVAS